MAKWAGGVLTAAGRRLQAKVEGGLTLALTRIKLGSGMETIEEVDALTDLVEVETSLAISAANVHGEVCTVEGVLRASALDHGFWCREFGIYANDPDDGEILYMVSVDEQPDWLPSEAETDVSVTFAMNIAVANATHITAQVDLTGLVDVDMLHAYTHTATRRTTYKEGDVLCFPTIPHGLVLECQSEGTTDEILPDVSRMACGDTKLDGTVLWQAKRPMLAPSGAYYYKPEWIYEAIGKLVQFAQAVQSGAADVESIDGRLVRVGGSGEEIDLDAIFIDNDRYAGTLFNYYTKEQPLASGFAWIRNTEIEGEIVNARPTIVLDDGSRITATKAKVVRSDGLFYYIDTISREPIVTSGAYDYTIATEDDIDDIFDRLGGAENGE